MKNSKFTLHFTTFDPQHGEREREEIYRIQSEKDLAYQMMRMQSLWIFSDFFASEYKDRAELEEAIEAEECMIAWITASTPAGEIELIRREILVTEYLPAADISWFEEE